MADAKVQRISVWLQVSPKWNQYYKDAYGEPTLGGLSLAGATVTKPKTPRGSVGTLVVKVTLEIPSSAFKSLQPEAVVIVPESMVQALQTVVAEVSDANAD